MKKRIALLIFAALSLTVLLGPKVKVDRNINPVELPPDLDRYLAESESRFKDIVPGTEKKIIWNNPAKKDKTKISIIYLHGFSATRPEVSPLCENIAKSLSANLYFTRLRGHGRGTEAMKGITVNDWLTDTVEAVEIGRRIGEKVIIISTSTGGTLTAWYGLEKDTKDILGVVMISPNFYPARSSSRILTWPWGKQLGRLILGEYREWKPQNEMHAKYWTYRQPSEIAVTMMGLVDMLMKMDFSKFNLPMLMIVSPKDKVVNVPLAKKRFEEASSRVKEIYEVTDSVDGSSHVVAGDILSPNTTGKLSSEITRFIRALDAR